MKQISFSAVRWHGRTFDREGVRYANHTCGGFSLRFTGKKLTAEVRSTAAQPPEDYACFLLLTVGGRERVFALSEGHQTLTLLEEAEPVTAEISLIKRTEQQYATFGVAALQADDDAVIEKTPEPSRRLLFIGDSITCGYGIGGAPEDPFMTEQEWGDLAFAARTARALNAGAQFVSRSGVGVWSSYTPDPDRRNTDPLITDLIPWTDRVGCQRLGAEQIPWNPDSFRPDGIVINLGTNDTTYTSGNELHRAEFAAAYERLLAGLRRDYPGAVIVCALGGIPQEEQDRLFEQIAGAVKKRRAAGDLAVYALRFPDPDAAESTGAAGHPSMKTQIRMAGELTEFLKGCLNW